MPLFVGIQTVIHHQQIKQRRMMKEINFTLIIIMITVFIIDAAHIPVAGNFDPFVDENQPQISNNMSSNESHLNVNLPSLDSIHNHVHQSSETNETHSFSNNTQLGKAGPSVDLIDSHAHSHDDDNTSAIDSAKRLLIQPSIDFLDSQLHGGDEHVHNNENPVDKEAADLNDFQRWLKEQNQTDQLNRFLLLQKEINQFHFDDTQDLNNKLNRTIEELKSAAKRNERPKHEL